MTQPTIFQVGKYYLWEDAKHKNRQVIIQCFNIDQDERTKENVYHYKVIIDTFYKKSNEKHSRNESTIQLWMKKNNMHEITKEELRIFFMIDKLSPKNSWEV